MDWCEHTGWAGLGPLAWEIGQVGGVGKAVCECSPKHVLSCGEAPFACMHGQPAC